MTISVAALAYMGVAIVMGAPIVTMLASPDEWTPPAAADRRVRWLAAGCLTVDALGIGLQILAAQQARLGGSDAPVWHDAVLLPIIAVLSGAAIVCVGLAVWVLLRESSDVGECATPGSEGNPDRRRTPTS